MAYAAVTSLKHTVDQLMEGQLCFPYDLVEQLKTLSKEASVIQDLLVDSADKCKDHKEMKNLEGWIRHMAQKAEDVIEEFVYINLETSDVTNISEEEYCLHNNMLKILDEINSIKTMWTKIQKETNIPKAVQAGNSSVEYSSQRSSNPDDTVVGLDVDLLKIKEKLTGEPRNLDVLTIVGMGGIGKTTLAKKIFNDDLIEYYFYKRAWITVSQNYQVRDVLLGLLCSVRELNDEIGRKCDEQLAELLYKSLRGQRYLIVMDDVWDRKSWYDLKRSFPDDKNGSRIVLTSRLEGVAVCANPDSPPYHMRFLNLDDSWELLCNKVFPKESCPCKLEVIGKEIAEKCQGLPLAILVIAGHLSNISKTKECWMTVAEGVRSLVSRDQEKCSQILALSYNFLPHHLKACFLYLGVFPEYSEIPAWRLIRLWIAEGILRAEWQKSLEEVAELCLEDLVSRSLIMVSKRKSDGAIKSCVIHELVRDLILRESQKEDFVNVQRLYVDTFPRDAYSKRRLSFHSHVGKSQHMLNSYINRSHDLRMSSLARMNYPYLFKKRFQCSLQPDIDKSHVLLTSRRNINHSFHMKPSILLNRSILFYGQRQDDGSHEMPSSYVIFTDFKLLRVLDMLAQCFEHFPAEITQLVHLRYLALSTRTYLPAKLSRLWNLQTLINELISGHIILPDDLWKMPQLRHVHLKNGGYLPCPVGQKFCGNSSLVLPYLYKLSSISFASCTREVFVCLPNLKELGIFETARDTAKSHDYLNHLVHLKELEKLKCVFLRSGKLPHLNSFPPKLRKLTLSGSFLPWHETNTLGMLPNLEVLKLQDYAFDGPEWEPAEEGFSMLKYLLIEKTNLVHWNAASIHFPALQQLVLRSCMDLQEIPSGIGEIPTLQTIHLEYSSPSAVSSAKLIQQEQQSMGNDGLFVWINPSFKTGMLCLPRFGTALAAHTKTVLYP